MFLNNMVLCLKLPEGMSKSILSHRRWGKHRQTLQGHGRCLLGQESAPSLSRPSACFSAAVVATQELSIPDEYQLKTSIYGILRLFWSPYFSYFFFNGVISKRTWISWSRGLKHGNVTARTGVNTVGIGEYLESGELRTDTIDSSPECC
jgi:hypothetical protein